MSGRRIGALVVASALAVGAGIGWRQWRSEPAEKQVPTARAERTTFVREVPAEGYLRAVESTPISAPREVTRPLQIAWLVPDGSRVEEGDPIVRFDATEIERELREGEADSAATASKIAKERVQTSSALRARERTAEVAESELEAAEAYELEDTELFSRNDVIESQIDSELASAKKEHASDVKGIERAVSRGKLDVLGVDKRQTDRKIARAQKALAKLEVTAPHDGIVVLARRFRGQKIRVGDTVWRGHKIAEIPLVEEMEAEVHVLEADAGGLAEGQEASVAVEAHPGIRYGARVKNVEALAKPLFKDVPVQYFKVKLGFDETDREVMKVGQRVRAKIVIEGEESIVVPRQAVFEREGEMVVYRRAGAEFEAVEVELGASSAGRVVIASGVEEGDEVALRDPNEEAGALVPGGEESESGGAGPGVMGAP